MAAPAHRLSTAAAAPIPRSLPAAAPSCWDPPEVQRPLPADQPDQPYTQQRPYEQSAYQNLGYPPVPTNLPYSQQPQPPNGWSPQPPHPHQQHAYWQQRNQQQELVLDQQPQPWNYVQPDPDQQVPMYANYHPWKPEYQPPSPLPLPNHSLYLLDHSKDSHNQPRNSLVEYPQWQQEYQPLRPIPSPPPQTHLPSTVQLLVAAQPPPPAVIFPPCSPDRIHILSIMPAAPPHVDDSRQPSRLHLPSSMKENTFEDNVTDLEKNMEENVDSNVNTIDELQTRSIKQLGEEAGKREISASDTEIELLDRLCTHTDNMARDNDLVKEEAKEEEIVTIVKKGSIAMDKCLPDNIKAQYHVLQIHGVFQMGLSLNIDISSTAFIKPPAVNFYGNNEGRRSIIWCAFDPGGDTSPLFSTLFVVTWFPP